MVPDDVVSFLDQLEIARTIFGKTSSVFPFVLFAFTDFQVTPLLLELFLQNYCNTSAYALQFRHFVDLLLNF